MSDNSFDEFKLKVEAVLFSYGEWISVHEIMEVLSVDSELLILNSLKALDEKYREGFSFKVESGEDGKWRMALKEDFEQIVTELISGTEIPKSVLKVLSVIAYEQPVTKTRLAEILGKSVKQEVEYLYKANFLSYEKNGIGKYYKVTKKFYDYFKIDDEADFRREANKSITTFFEESAKNIVEDGFGDSNVINSEFERKEEDNSLK